MTASSREMAGYVGRRRVALVFGVMVKPMLVNSARDQLGEEVRASRLRADGRRPLAVNLSETILLTRKLFELRDAAQRAR